MERATNKITFYAILIIFLVSLFYCYDYLLQISISVFLPSIKHHFHLNDFKLGLIGSIFFLSYVAMQIPGGYCIDRFGPWVIALWMSGLCAIGALVMHFAIHSYWLLLLSRLLIGLGSSVAFLCAIKVISVAAPLRLFSFFVGVLQALAGIGAIVGQAPIAYLNLYYPWNQVALLFFGIALIFTIFFIGLVKQNSHPKLSQNPQQNRQAVWHVLKNKSLLKISFLSFIAWSPVASLAGFWFVQYLHDVGHMTTVVAGSLISAFWVGVIIGSVITPVISEWMGRRKPVLIIGFVMQALAITLIILFPSFTNCLILSLFLLGFMSPIQGFCVVLAKDLNLKEGFGVASGLINMFGAVSGGVMQFVIGFLLTYVFEGAAHPYTWAFCSYLLLSFVGILICSIAYKETHPIMQTGGIHES